MPSTFTPNFALEKPGDGEQDGFWSFSLNGNFNRVDEALTSAITMTGSPPSLVTPLDGARRLATPAAGEIIVEEYDAGAGAWVELFDSRDKQSSSVSAFPAGSIIGWFGVSIPSGWAACDGTNGTPDMRNLVVLGAGGTFANGATGGSLAAGSTGSAGGHSHTGATGRTTLTEGDMPSHRHFTVAESTDENLFSPALSSSNTVKRAATNGSNDAEYVLTGDTVNDATLSRTSAAGGLIGGGTAGHRHTISTDGDHTHTVTQTLPPFIAIQFIMKL